MSHSHKHFGGFEEKYRATFQTVSWTGTGTQNRQIPLDIPAEYANITDETGNWRFYVLNWWGWNTRYQKGDPCPNAMRIVQKGANSYLELNNAHGSNWCNVLNSVYYGFVIAQNP